MLATNRASVRAALALIIGLGAATIAAAQTTYYVNGSCGDDSWTGLSPVCEGPNGPKATIQAGIDAADHFDEVVVADGIYRGAGNKNLEFFTKEMSIRSTGGPEKCIIDCEEDGFGFTFCTLPDDRPVTIEGFTIRNGRGVFAGGICITRAEVTIDNCIIEQCVGRGTSYFAGGIYIQESPVQILRTVIRANRMEVGSSLMGGGGVFVFGRSEVTIEDSRIEANEARVSSGNALTGGGVFVEEDGTIRMARCVVAGNRSINQSTSASGGGVFVMGGPFGPSTIVETEFERNEAIDETGRSTSKGGGAVVGRDCIVEDCVFRENVADLGGGVYVAGDHVRIQRVTFADNHAGQDGGGLYSAQSSGRFEHLRFTGNTAVRDGGGAYWEYGGVIADCDFVGNRADRDGGGLRGVNMQRGIIAGNEAGRNGGGVMAPWDQRFVDTLIVGNRCAGSGGGVYTLESASAVINATIAGNASGAGGGGLHIENSGNGGNRALINSIIRDNLPVSVFDNSGRLRIERSNIERSNIEGGWPGVGNIDADPRFVDPANGDYRLGPRSPCIDSGDNRDVFSAVDLAGEPRRFDDPGMPDAGIGMNRVVDMGAYEFQGASTGFITVHPRPGLADSPNQLQAAGATPGERVYFIYGFTSGATSVPGCSGVTIEIANAQIAAQSDADGQGNAAAIINVPPAAARRTILLQALDHSACEVSNLVRYRFP